MGIPGTLLSIYVIKRIGTKKLQILGFVIIALSLFLFAGLYKYCTNHGDNNALFTIYCLLLFSLNFGPNVTTYVLPAQTYPKKIRSTCNGISAAMGKLGAVTGCYLFNINNFVLIMFLSGFISMIGAFLSIYIEDLDTDNDELKVGIRESEDVENIITKT
jgi:PHS family inorganic phosphate transporter-like MFS transporter